MPGSPKSFRAVLFHFRYLLNVPKGARPKKTLKVTHTQEKIISAAQTLCDLWSDISRRWPEVSGENYSLKEENGTEILNDDCYQALPNNALLQISWSSSQTGNCH